MKSLEFQAVVLAGGRGTRLTDLNGDRPKCLLQIAAYPLIFYPLSLLQKYGFQEAIVVVIDSQKNEIQQKIDRTPLKLKIDYFTITENDDLGTASTLKLLSER
jgi:translation initiation factor eIF-2B subunit gamma